MFKFFKIGTSKFKVYRYSCDEFVVADQNVFLGPVIHSPGPENYFESHPPYKTYLVCYSFRIRFQKGQ